MNDISAKPTDPTARSITTLSKKLAMPILTRSTQRKSEAFRRLKPSEIEALVKNLPERYVSEVRQFFLRLPTVIDGDFVGYLAQYCTQTALSRVSYEVIWEGYQRMQFPANFKRTKTSYDQQLDSFSVEVCNTYLKRAQQIVEYLIRRGWTVGEIAFHIGVNVAVLGAVRNGAMLEFNAMRKLETLFDGGNCDTAWNGGENRDGF